MVAAQRMLAGLLILAPAFAADIDALLKSAATYEYGQSSAAARELEEVVVRASANRAEAAAIEKKIVAVLEAASTTVPGRDAMCRGLAVIGTAASVPVLQKMLAKPETVEIARYALEAIPSPAAVEALRAAAGSAQGKAKAGIISSLGRRKDAASAPMLRYLLNAPEEVVSAAAAGALGEIGGQGALGALLSAKMTPAVGDAVMRVLEGMPPAEAVPFYRRLMAPSQPDAVRVAALNGFARTKDPDGRRLLITALSDHSAALRALAIRELAAMPGFDLAPEVAKLEEADQVRALVALSERRQGVAPLVFRTSAKAQSEAVRAAALRGLAVCGDAADIPLLAQRAAEAGGDEQAAARESLSRLKGADQAIAGAIADAPAKTKIELIRAAGDRGIASAAPVLLKTAVDPDRAIRRESIRALRDTAGPGDVKQVVALLVSAGDDSDRKELERAVAAAVRRSKQASVDDVVSSLRSASDADVKASLLSVLAMVGNKDGLPVIREALKSGDADVSRAAINALAEWPSAEPAQDLLAVAQSASQPAQQVLALRGYVKLVQIPADRTPAETAKLLAAGMAAARRPDEKKLVLAAATRVVCQESLDLAKTAANDPAVAAEAKMAVQNLERALSYRR